MWLRVRNEIKYRIRNEAGEDERGTILGLTGSTLQGDLMEGGKVRERDRGSVAMVIAQPKDGWPGTLDFIYSLRPYLG